MEIKLKDAQDLHNIFRAFRSFDGLGSWFRGQANVGWQLLPKAGRTEYLLPDNRDLGRFKDWRNQAIAYEQIPESDLESLAIAQHHGLATRLLDWTKNPLVATYFAINSDPTSDGVVYILDVLNEFATIATPLENLKNYDGVICFIPRAIAPRIINQGGLFTIHNPPDKEILQAPSRFNKDELNLKKLIIPKEMKEEVASMLSDYGINESFLFPGLDGLSRQNNRKTELLVQRRNKA